MIITEFGSIRVAMRIMKRTFFPLKSNLAKPYATREHETIVNNTVGMTSRNVLLKYLAYVNVPVVSHPFAKASKLQEEGRSFRLPNISLLVLKHARSIQKTGKSITTPTITRMMYIIVDLIPL